MTLEFGSHKMKIYSSLTIIIILTLTKIHLVRCLARWPPAYLKECPEQLVVHNKGFYVKEGKLYGIFKRVARFQADEKYYKVRVYSLSGPYPDISPNTREFDPSRGSQVIREIANKADDDNRFEGYQFDGKIIIFSHYFSYFQEEANASSSWDKQPMFKFGAVGQVWIGCPQPLCFDATIDAAEILDKDEHPTFFRGHYMYKKEDKYVAKKAQLSTVVFPSPEAHFDSVIYHDLWTHVCKGDSVIVYFAQSHQQLNYIVESNLQSPTLGFDQSHPRYQYWLSIPRKRLLPQIKNIDAGLKINYNNDEYLFYTNASHYCLVKVTNFVDRLINFVDMKVACDQDGKVEDCQTMNTDLETDNRLGTLSDFGFAFSGGSMGDAFKQEDTYYFMDGWEYVTIPEKVQKDKEKTLEMLLNEPDYRVELIRIPIMNKTFECDESKYKLINVNSSAYHDEVYPYFYPNEIVYLQREVPDISSKVSVTGIVLVTLLCTLIVVLGGITLYLFSPKEKQDQFYQLKGTISPASSRRSPKAPSSASQASGDVSELEEEDYFESELESEPEDNRAQIVLQTMLGVDSKMQA